MGNLFHLAIPVNDLQEAKIFYGEKLGCKQGRSDKTWIDFSLYGHQLVTHYVPGYRPSQFFNEVDNDAVPVPHFGIILLIDEWLELAVRLEASGIEFVIKPHIRFKDMPGEQGTMFFHDPSGNALEFKGFRSFDSVFAK
ncbi:MAG TPA: VOC family protein [Pyrinomonadaceae bacterium]|jgi:extradiol dioxygenase family protein|nr:VOC family protein [Pyrinomonadaceae bacterium]